MSVLVGKSITQINLVDQVVEGLVSEFLFRPRVKQRSGE